ncbi:MAG: alpha/beta hydrolase [Bryobacterales bacterium]|nr:alpha/beta hydrolase [Bryobacterales bacterium]
MNRRCFLTFAGAPFQFLLNAQGANPQTLIYRTVGGCEIRADVYGAVAGAAKPAVMWIHGGALITGSRKSLGGKFHQALIEAGYAVVSIDYRLAPETKLPGIVEDIRDAWRWLHQEALSRFGIDPKRIAVAGGSAGGYLTLMCGFAVNPTPRALVSYYGYGDITTSWYAEPDEFYRKSPLVAKDEAYGSVGTAPVSEPPGGHQRGRFYLYSRQQGLWPKEVAGRDPRKEPAWFDRYCPIRNVTGRYPPTLLIHGTEDTDVPYSESKNMAERLARAGVKHEFITVDGAGHGLSGASTEETSRIAARAVGFVKANT